MNFKCTKLRKNVFRNCLLPFGPEFHPPPLNCYLQAQTIQFCELQFILSFYNSVKFDLSLREERRLRMLTNRAQRKIGGKRQ
jgi:hypothetical protein